VGWRIDVANDASLSPLQRIATAKCVPSVRGARRRRLRSGSRDREQLHAISRGGVYPAPAKEQRAVVVASGWAVDDRETVAVIEDLYRGLARGEPLGAARRGASDAAA
jgi:hypothetical protein